MEEMEMNETHNVFSRGEISAAVEAAGLRVREWVEFADIADDLEKARAEMVEGEPWHRKFLLVAARG
jgi:hypothetical protein